MTWFVKKAIAEAVRSVVIKLTTALRKLRGTYEYGKALQYINDAKAVHQALVKAYHEVGNKKTATEADGEVRYSINSTNITSGKPVEDYPYNIQTVIEGYLDAVNPLLLEKTKYFREHGEVKFERVDFGTVSDKEVDELKNRLGVDFSGYKHSTNSSAIIHINKRHGENGQHDNTMAKAEDAARVDYILREFDTVDFLRKEGKVVYSKNFGNKNNIPSNLLLYTKKINGTYYAVVAVGENKYKKLWVETCFMAKNKEGITQALHDEISSLGFTSETPLASLPSSTNVSQEEADVKGDDLSGGEVKFSFAGPRAETADMSALEKAKSMEQGKATEEDILRKTGWYRGVDGEWRFEISDEDAEFSRRGDLEFKKEHPDYARYRELFDTQEKYVLGLPGGRELTTDEREEYRNLRETWKNTFRENGKVGDGSNVQKRLAAYFQHDKLYEAYPKLRDVELIFNEYEKGASYSKASRKITLNGNKSEWQNKKSLIHEIQHWIQDEEGFASGSSEEYWQERYSEQFKNNDAQIKMLEQQRKELYAKAKPLYKDIGFSDYFNELLSKLEQGEITVEDYEKMTGEYVKEHSLELYELREKIFRINSELEDMYRNRKTAEELYMNTAGEIEARDASKRVNMTEEERRDSMPKRGDENTVFADYSEYGLDRIEENKKTADEAVEEAIFFPDENDVKVFSEQIDNWLKGKMPKRNYFKLGSTPSVLRAIGINSLPLYMNQSVMAKITGEKHSIALDDIKSLPYELSDPLMVFESSTEENSVVVITTLNTKTNKEVIVAIRLDGATKLGQSNVVVSMYGKDNIKGFIEKHIALDKLKYIDIKRSQAWLRIIGLQLPEMNTKLNSNNSILTKEDIVNRYYAQNTEIKFSMPAPTSQVQYEDRAYKLYKEMQASIEEKLGIKIGDETVQAVQGLADSIARGDMERTATWQDELENSIMQHDMIYDEVDASDTVLTEYLRDMRKSGRKIMVTKYASQDLTAAEINSIFGSDLWRRNTGLDVDVLYDDLVAHGAQLPEAFSVQDKLIAIKKTKEAGKTVAEIPLIDRDDVAILVNDALQNAVNAVSEVERAREDAVYTSSTASGPPSPQGEGYTREPVSNTNVTATIGHLNEMHEAIENATDDVQKIGLEDAYREEQLKFFEWILPHFTHANERGITGDYCFHTNAELDAERAEQKTKSLSK